jgi:hypothetical protein
MKSKQWTLVTLCIVCLLATSCTSTEDLTASGSDEWSRGVVLDTTEADPVAVTVWQDITFVVWVAEDGRLRLAHLDTALGLEEMISLTLTAAYPREMRLWAESADRLHVAWVDSVDGDPTVIYAQVAPSESEPLLRQEIPLPTNAHHVHTVLQLETRRLDVFCSANHYQNSGIHHRAIDLSGNEVAPGVQLTETGWQPKAAQAESGAIHLAWADTELRGYVDVWYTLFDPENQSLENPSPVAEVRLKRGQIFYGPAVGSVGGQVVLAWSSGSRMPAQGYFNRQWGGADLGGGFGSTASGPASTVRGDRPQYVMVSSAQAEATSSIQNLTEENFVEAWREPCMRVASNQTWAIFSGWVAERSRARLQVVTIPFDESGQGGSILVTNSWAPSVQPDLAVSADGTLRAAWFEPIGDDLYQIVVASTTPEAREALGGFRLAEWWDNVAGVWLDAIGLLGFAPYMLSWMLLPLGLLLIGTFARPSRMRGWEAAIWLGAAILLQIAGKRYLLSVLIPFGPGLADIALSLAPYALGAGLMWVYWRWKEEPILLVAYCLVIVMDFAFSLFVGMPRLLWTF